MTKPSLSRPLKLLKAHLTIGVSREVLEDLEQKAIDDDALPLKGSEFTRVESYCLRTGIRGIAQIAPLFLLASRLGRNSTGRRAKLTAQFAEAARELNRINGQLTALIRHKQKAPAAKAGKGSRRSATA